jgi:hypothetical protein
MTHDTLMMTVAAMRRIVTEKAPEIHKMMVACDHKWALPLTDPKRVPTCDEIESELLRLIGTAGREMKGHGATHTCCGTGGLQVSITEWGTGRVTYQVLYSPCLYHRSL